MPADRVIGIDGGGSRTRVVLAGLGGQVVRTVMAGGTNLTTIGMDIVIQRLSAAVGECLTAAGAGAETSPDTGTAGTATGMGTRTEAGAVRYAVAGYAGAGDPTRAVAVTEAALAAAGVHCPIEVFADPELAFASGATGPDGLVLVVGTGTVAARVVGWRSTRTVDGHGWLLGDDGSGFWIGAAGLRAVLRTLDGRGQQTDLVRRLTAEVGAAALDPKRVRGELVQAIMSGPPAALARLAPAVLAAAAEGDEVATGIVDAAVDHILTTVAALDPAPGEQLVLAGGIAGEGSPLGPRLAAQLATRFCVDPVPVTDGTAGAVHLALRALTHPRP